jgi:hypothetical protein
MGALSPLAVLSGALNRSKLRLPWRAVGDKIRSNSQGWEDARVIGERQVLMVGATLPFARAGAGEVREHLQDGLHEAPDDFE